MSTSDKIFERIRILTAERRFFFAQDLQGITTYDGLNTALSLLHRLGHIVRASPGIYTLAPAQHPPEDIHWTDDLAWCMARRIKASAAFDGLRTAIRLGLPVGRSTQHVYLSNGAATSVSFWGHRIELRRVKPALLERAGTYLVQRLQALYWVGEEALAFPDQGNSQVSAPLFSISELAELRALTPTRYMPLVTRYAALPD